MGSLMKLVLKRGMAPKAQRQKLMSFDKGRTPVYPDEDD
jgi:hypothetical protein